jgi:hypothetical protein
MSKFGMGFGDVTCSQSLCPRVKPDRLHNPRVGYCLVCGVDDCEDADDRGGRGGGRTRGMTHAGECVSKLDDVEATSKRFDLWKKVFATTKTRTCLFGVWKQP